MQQMSNSITSQRVLGAFESWAHRTEIAEYNINREYIQNIVKRTQLCLLVFGVRTNPQYTDSYMNSSQSSRYFGKNYFRRKRRQDNLRRAKTGDFSADERLWYAIKQGREPPAHQQPVRKQKSAKITHLHGSGTELSPDPADTFVAREEHETASVTRTGKTPISGNWDAEIFRPDSDAPAISIATSSTAIDTSIDNPLEPWSPTNADASRRSVERRYQGAKDGRFEYHLRTDEFSKYLKNNDE